LQDAIAFFKLDAQGAKTQRANRAKGPAKPAPRKATMAQLGHRPAMQRKADDGNGHLPEKQTDGGIALNMAQARNSQDLDAAFERF
jgi:hypothetical protein